MNVRRLWRLRSRRRCTFGTRRSIRSQPPSRRLLPSRPLPPTAPASVAEVEPTPVAYLEPDPGVIEPEPPQIIQSEPQPPDLSTSAPIVTAPRLAAGPNAFQRLRDAVAVRLALRRGAGSNFDPGVEIVSGTGAPTWDQRARRHHRSLNPPVVAAHSASGCRAPVATAGGQAESSQPLHGPGRGRAAGQRKQRSTRSQAGAVAPETHDADQPVEATAPLELADVLSEVAILAAPLERTTSPVADVPAPTPAPSAGMPTAAPPSSMSGTTPCPRSLPASTRQAEKTTSVHFGVTAEPVSAPVPGRHVRRLHSQKADRREWNPTRPVTGRHVLPLGGPAVGAADRDRRLWLFGAVTVVLMLLGLLVGRQVTQTGPLVASTNPRSTPQRSSHNSGHDRTPSDCHPGSGPDRSHPDSADAGSSSRKSRRWATGAVGSRLPTFATVCTRMTSAWCSTWRFPTP